MNPKQKQLYIIIGVIVVAIVAVGAAIALSGRNNKPDLDYTAMPSSRTSDGAFVLGDPAAPVTIIEFADFACPHCQAYEPEIARFVKDYVLTGRARFEFRMFGTNAGGQQTIFAGQLAECIAEDDPGVFWEAHDVLFELGATGAYFAEDMGRVVAQRVGAGSYTELLTCSREADQITTDMDFGRQMGVSGTPAVMIRYNDGPAQWITYNGTTYNRGGVPYDVLAAVVENYQSQ
ncbi:MAG TPA: thioredoxin domain-containing protein [Oceanobacillus sp.]|nr:thioredoxin domain-containing protein [Oceanobacillus sp.]